MQTHHLTNVNRTNKTAICSICGPTDIYIYSTGDRFCATKQRLYIREYARRKRQERTQNAPPKPPGRPRTRPLKEPKEPKQRQYGTEAHVLSEVDDLNKVAVCSVCGPVKIYVSIHPGGEYITRRCSKANSQNVLAAKKARKSSNRAYIDEYKVQQGCQRCGYSASPIGLDLHHRNPSEKDLKISKANSYSRERLIRELEKCDVLCAICHRLVHDELSYAYE